MENSDKTALRILSLTTKLDSGGALTNATYDAQDRVLTYGNRSYTYTGKNERVFKYTEGANLSREFNYDSMGALSKVIVGKRNTTTGLMEFSTFTYVNDGLGRRLEKKLNGAIVNRYVYDANSRFVGELDITGKVSSRFVYGKYSHSPDYMVKAGVNYKFIHDQLGSVRLVVNATSGAIASSLDYDEFGNLRSGSIAPNFQPFGFAGGLRDADAGTVRFGVRDYDPVTGRWTSKDPILFEGGDANLYGYVLQDPVNFVDPNGQLGIFVPYLAFETGFFIGATINWFFFSMPFSKTYEGANPALNFIDSFLPSSGFFLDPRTLQSMMNMFKYKEQTSCEPK